MKVTGDWRLVRATQELCATLTEAGHQALFVGGCVRNALLGAPVADIDIATDAWPERVMHLAMAAGLKVVPTGIDHGTVTVLAGGIAHEVTTFRRDVATDGRRAVVEFSTQIAEDAMRRDFTMNALYADAAGNLVDPLGGLPDLLARHLRFVGAPEARIREDYLRILRFFRFHAWYGDPDAGLDAEGLAACAELAEGLEGLSRERVGAEMRKLLSAADPAPSIAAMAQTGILGRILPGAVDRPLAPLVHLEAGTNMPVRWLRRLVSIGGQAGAEGLRLSRAEHGTLAALLAALEGGESLGASAYRWGGAAASDALLIKAASLGNDLPAGWQDAVQAGTEARFPIKAADLMPEMSGAALGLRLRALEEAWIASGFALSKSALLAR